MSPVSSCHPSVPPPFSPVSFPCPSRSSCPHCVPPCRSVWPPSLVCPLSPPLVPHIPCPISPLSPSGPLRHPSCPLIPAVPSLSQLRFSFPEATAASAFGVWVTPHNAHAGARAGRGLPHPPALKAEPRGVGPVRARFLFWGRDRPAGSRSVPGVPRPWTPPGGCASSPGWWPR